MSPQEIEKLLGGYATDTLTEEERRALFEAALGNQALFDALADDQALKELLDDPPSRAQLLAALREERVTPLARVAAWWRRPSFLAAAAAVAAGIVTIAIVIPRKPAAEKQAAVAMNAPLREAPAPPAESVRQSVAEPKPAAAAPFGSMRRAAVERRREPDRDAALARPSGGGGGGPRKPAAPEAVAMAPAAAPPPAPAAAPAAPPPPAQPAVSQAQAQLRATEELKQQEQAKAADAVAPGGAAGFRQEDRKKELASAAGARQLYYAMQPAVVGGFMDQSTVSKSKKAFGRPMAAAGRVATPPPAPAIGGVRYSILRRTPDGSFTEVDPAAPFAPGDALRIRFETNQAGNLAVMEHPAGSPWTLRLAARTQPGVPILMPAESTIDVTAAGPLHFFVRFSRSLRGEARLDQVTPTPNLLRESAANSVYVVNPAASADPTVDFELTIHTR